MRHFWKYTTAALAILIFLAGCDVMQQDADVSTLSIDDQPVYFVTNSTGFIDLAARIKTPEKFRIEVSSTTRRGDLKDLGKGLLQYTPFGGNASVRDSFRYSIISATGETVGSDSLRIIVGADSTVRPCAIYTRNDYAYNVTGPITVDVLANDIGCSGPVTVSINTDVPPAAGTATVVANKIVYTPGAAFTGKDAVFYKATGSDATNSTVFGMLYITSSEQCSAVLNDDNVTGAAVLPKGTTINIKALGNDQFCPGSLVQFSIAVTPLYGTAQIVDDFIIYTAPDTIRSYPFIDRLTYQLCIDGICGQAVVNIKSAVTTPCTLAASNDAFDISQNDIPVMFLDILRNDQVCNTPTKITITSQSQYGTVEVSEDGKMVKYTRDPAHELDDSFEYKICIGSSCSTATATIKRQ